MPVVVRMEGTNVELGKKMLAESGLNFTSADDMGDGAQKVVALAGGVRQRCVEPIRPGGARRANARADARP